MRATPSSPLKWGPTGTRPDLLILFGGSGAETFVVEAKGNSRDRKALEVNRATLVALHLGRMKDEGTLLPEHVSMGKLGNVNGALESVATYEGTADIHALVIGGAVTGLNAFR